jgi:hypothetical protein
MTALNNTARALIYAASEMGEKLTVAGDGTVSSVKAVDNKTVVLAAETSIATAEAHVIAVHPQIGTIKG